MGAPELGQAKARAAAAGKKTLETPQPNDTAAFGRKSGPPLDKKKTGDVSMTPSKSPSPPPPPVEKPSDGTVPLDALPDKDLVALAKAQKIKVADFEDRDAVVAALTEAGITKVVLPPSP